VADGMCTAKEETIGVGGATGTVEVGIADAATGVVDTIALLVLGEKSIIINISSVILSPNTAFSNGASIFPVHDLIDTIFSAVFGPNFGINCIALSVAKFICTTDAVVPILPVGVAFVVFPGNVPVITGLGGVNTALIFLETGVLLAPTTLDGSVPTTVDIVPETPTAETTTVDATVDVTVVTAGFIFASAISK